jgi:hypothetical protein
MVFKSKFSKSSSAEQLDLVDTISDGDKLRRKRQLLIILLILTIGLSFVFATYRFFKNTLSAKTFPKISLNFSLPALNRTLDPGQGLNQIFKKDYDSWSVFIESDDFSWSKNFNQSLESQNLTTQKEKLTISSPITDGPTKSLLPEGVIFRQIIEESAPSSKFYFLLSVPDRQIFIVLYPPQNDPSSVKLVSELVEKIYWSVIQSD